MGPGAMLKLKVAALGLIRVSCPKSSCWACAVASVKHKRMDSNVFIFMVDSCFTTTDWIVLKKEDRL